MLLRPPTPVARSKRHAFRASQHGFLADGLAFDERAYLQAYPDVHTVVERGVLASGLEHYQRYGRWEGRSYPERQGFAALVARFLFWLEALLRVLESHFRPWDLTLRLLAEGVHPRVPLGGPLGMQNYRKGPWRSELPWYATGYVLAELVIESPEESTVWLAQPLSVDGEPLGELQTLQCKASRMAKRVLRIPPEARHIEWRQAGDEKAWIGSFQLKPISDRTAARMVKKRLSRPDAGESPRVPRRARAHEHLDILWAAYQNTFPFLGRPPYAWWIQCRELAYTRSLDARAAQSVAQLPAELLFSILVPIYDTDPTLLRACLDAIVGQSYPHWEACLVDDASTHPEVREVLLEYTERDPRFRAHFRKRNGHISRTSQDALEMAKAEFVVLVDHDDELAPHALLLVAEALRDHPDALLLYSDEDKLDASGNRCEPHFKPDFDPDRLLGHNYIAHLLVARRSEVIERGGFRAGFEGSQDHDLVLRLVAGQPADRIVHVPEVLYHWRKHPGSTAAELASKPYALEAGRHAVAAFLGHQRLDARVDIDTQGQCLHVRWPLPPNPPRVSIIVPTRDGLPHVSKCIRSLLDNTDYPDFEIIVVDNGSRDEQTLRYLEHAAEDERVVVLRYDQPFNFSAINNFAAERVTGRVLAFVNDDVYAVEPGWLREMVSHALRPGVGCVGAKLLYPDGRIQHGGVVLGIGGIAGHAFKYSSGAGNGYYSKLRMAHTVSAVTGACLVIERHKFEQVGRFDEALTVALNDVDLCLRVRAGGYRNVLTPYAVLVHEESASRGSDETEATRERFAAERRILRERWGRQLTHDPYYSPHLSLEYEDFSLRTSYAEENSDS